VAWAADPTKGRRLDVGPDAQAHTPDTPSTRLEQRATRIGFSVAPLVAMVIGEAVGEHDEQPAGSPRPLLDDRCAMADGGTEPRVGPRCASCEATAYGSVELVVERLDSQQLHRAPPPGVERVHGDTIAQRVESRSHRGRHPTLVLMDRTPARSDLASRTRHIEQNEHREVPLPSERFDVQRRLVERHPRRDIDS
jgi:hypothetical protein